jgi:hypothetical protein
VELEFTADGTFVGNPPSYFADLNLAADGVSCFSGNVPSFCASGNAADWDWSASSGGFVGSFNTGNLVTKWTVNQNNATTLDVLGSLSLVGPEPVIGLWFQLGGFSPIPGTLNFANTAAIRFHLPTGVTLTSASGVFGTSTSTPLLTITLSGNSVIVSWPLPSTGWTLQTNSSLDPGTWVNYTGSVVNNTVTKTLPTGSLFFRLRHS